MVQTQVNADGPDPAVSSAAEAGLPEKPDAFVSYSRADVGRVEAILTPLREAEVALWFDADNIPLTADWKREIDRGIARAPTMLFMLSDQSLQSTHCADELETALAYGKRIVPVALQAPTEDVPDTLSRPNWILAMDRSPEEIADDVLQSIETDLEWAESHTRLLERALEWEAQDRDGSLVLRGSDLTRARSEVAAARDAEPVVTSLQRNYIAASASAQTRRRAMGGVVGGALALITIAAIIAVLQWRRAEANEQVAESLRLASDGSLAFDDQLDLGLLLVLEGIATDANQQVESALIRGLTGGPGLRGVSTISDVELEAAEFDARGAVAGILDTNNQPFLWRSGDLAMTALDVDRVTSVAMSADGSIAALGTTDAVVIVDVANGAVETTCPQAGMVESVAVNASGDRVAIVTLTEQGRVLAAIDAACTLAFQPVPARAATDVSISAIGDVIATGSTTEGVGLWETFSGLPFPALPGAAEMAIRSVAFAPDGDLVAAGTDDGDIRIWNTRVADPPVEVVGSHDARVTTLTFDLEGSQLLSGSIDGTTRVWNAVTGEPEASTLESLPPDRTVTTVLAVAFGADQALARSVHGEGRALEWDLAGSSPLATRVSLQDGVTSIDIAGGTLALGGSEGLELVPVAAASPGAGVMAYSEPVRAVAFMPDEVSVVVGLESGSRLVVDPIGVVRAGPFPGPLSGSDGDRRALSVAVDPDGSHIASGHGDGTVRIVDVADGSERVLRHGTGYVSEVRFADGGQLVLSAGEDATVRAWSVDTDQEVLTFTGHDATVDALAVHPSESLAVSGSDDRGILIWDYTSGDVVRRLTGHTDRVVSVALSESGDHLVSSSEDATVIVWDLESGAVIGQPLRNEFGSKADSVAFDPATPTVAFAGGPGVHRWDLTPHIVEKAACSIAGDRRMTVSEIARFLASEVPRYDCVAGR